MRQLHKHMPLLALTLLALLAGLWAGLIRLGWSWPALQPQLPSSHGPLMVSGFLGTLIGLERTVALALARQGRGQPTWTLYLGPIASGAGALCLILGLPVSLGAGLLWLGSMGLLGLFGFILQRQRALYTAVMTLGALCWLVGNTLWLAGRPIHQAVWWWAGFLILTIAGERLELSRLTRLRRSHHLAFLAAVSLLFFGFVTVGIQLDWGVRLVGVGLIALAAWLLRYDIARRTIYQTGLPRFIAACLLSGYVWLLLAGIMAVIVGGVVAGFQYDALLHAIFLGFVFTMIFGHAPIIFPAISGLSLRYQPSFYLHLLLLHVSLLLRVAGDLLLWTPGRKWGGLLNVLVLLLFLGNTAVAVYGERQNVRGRTK